MSSDTHLKPIADAKSLASLVLVGAVGCGKTALMKALLQTAGEVRKTQAPVFHPNNVIDTPGEFTGRQAYYGALVTTIVEVDTVVYVQPANSSDFSMPAGLLKVYPDKRVVGVISKADLPDADPVRASRILQENGIEEPYFTTSAVTNNGVEKLRRYLISLQADTGATGQHTSAHRQPEPMSDDKKQSIRYSG